MDGFGYFISIIGFIAGVGALGQVLRLKQRVSDLEEPLKQQKQMKRILTKTEVQELVKNKKEK